MDWFNANKAAIGGLLTVIGGVLSQQSPNNPDLMIWAQLCLAVGTFLAGGGMLKPDSHYRQDGYYKPDKLKRQEPVGGK